MWYLVIVHADIEFIVQFESQAPHDSSEPQTVVGVHCLCFRCDIEDVLSLVQWTHILTYTNTLLSHFTVYTLLCAEVVGIWKPHYHGVSPKRLHIHPALQACASPSHSRALQWHPKQPGTSKPRSNYSISTWNPLSANVFDTYRARLDF